jgi:hypothetical protein
VLLHILDHEKAGGWMSLAVSRLCLVGFDAITNMIVNYIYNFGTALLAAMLVLIFVWAASLKLLNRSEFQRGLRALPWMGATSSQLVSIILPILELFFAVGLLLGWRGADAGLAVLLAVFVLIALYAIANRLRVPCNCFGTSENVLSIGTVNRNLVLLAMVGISSLRLNAPLTLFEIVFAGLLLVFAHSFAQLRINSNLIQELRAIGGLPAR